MAARRTKNLKHQDREALLVQACERLRIWEQFAEKFYSLPTKKQNRATAERFQRLIRQEWVLTIQHALSYLLSTQGQRIRGPARRRLQSLQKKCPGPNITKISPSLGYSVHPIEFVLHLDILLVKVAEKDTD